MLRDKKFVVGQIVALLTALAGLVLLSACAELLPRQAVPGNAAIATPTATVSENISAPTTQPPTAVPTVTAAPTATSAPAPTATATSKPQPKPTATATPVPAGKILTPAEAEKIIASRAKEALLAIKNKDGQKLATFVHPDLGLRFSPYAYVSKENKLFTPELVKTLFTSNIKYTWGYQDGSGKPIVTTFKDYYSKFVYTHDFANAPEVYYNQFIERGNTIDNSKQFYPGSIVVEYHFPGFDQQLGGMDWESLKLVFSQKNSNWYLAGIIHDEWTI